MIINNVLVELDSPGFIILWIVLIFAFLCLVGFIIRKFVILKKDEVNKEINESETVQKELDRVLEKVTDEETAKQINDYKQDDDKE